MKMNRKIFISNKGLPYFILTLIGIAFFIPLLWVLLASFDTNASQALKIPQNFTLGNYADVLKNHSNQRSFGIGLIISLGQSILVVLLSVIAAYPLSRYMMKGKKLFMYSILFMTSLPITAVMVPVYQLFVSIKFYDNIFGVMIFFTASALPYGIWMMKNFMDTVPVDLEESAWVDGASTLTSIHKIVAPLMLPGICTVAIFTFSGSWGNFFVPYILLNTAQNFPASVKLYQYFGSHGMIAYSGLAAYSILYSMPSIMLYALSQRFMSQGFSMEGAAKG